MKPPAELSDADRDRLRQQLGREPDGAVSVETYCPAGHPQVVRVYPLRRTPVEIAPFPTLFWLACQDLGAQVAALEAGGLIAKLEQQLAADAEFRERLFDDHRRYTARRWQTLTPDDRALVRHAGLTDSLLQRGIGGIADWQFIKCLHLHYAHHLAVGSTVGAEIEHSGEVTPCAQIAAD